MSRLKKFAFPLSVERILIMLERFRKGAIRRMAKRKNPAAVALGRRGGKKGAKARMEKLTPEQRSEIARNASLARWSKRKD